MRILLSLTLSLAACDGGAGTDPTSLPVARACGSPATPGGIGEACSVRADCAEGPGLHCPSPMDPSRLGFCTKLCDPLGDDDCGPGAQCAYVGAGGRCVPAACAADLSQSLPTSDDSAAGRVNDLGIGQPCESGFDCTGSGAKLCEAGQRVGGFDFCTMDCVYAEPKPFADECGAEATCAYVGAGLGRCVPTVDAQRLAEAPPEIPEVSVPCDLAAPANGQGVGQPCDAHADCADYTVASSCPKAILEGLPNWCSHLCDFEDDASCGEGAFCWWRPAKEGGMVGSCAPEGCRVD